MAKTSGDFEREFIETAREKTGRSIDEWLKLVERTGMKKTMDILNWLKTEHKLNHMQSQLVAGIYLNNGKPVYQDEANLQENQFAKAEGMKPLFEVVSESILKWFPDTRLIPKKTYLSFTAVKEFAAVNVKPGELRLGLDLGEEPMNGRLQKSKLTGPMPRISHMVILTGKEQLDKSLQGFLQHSYDRSHKK